MKKLIILLILIILFGGNRVSAQKGENEILMTIGTKQVTKGEFERIFKKNNQNAEIDKKALDEYLDLFVKFKLKVIEAENLGLDTAKAFKDELSGYRKQLIKPYFTDDAIIDTLAKEAYERLKTDLEVSHILINIKGDTMPAFDKAMKIRERIKKGESFDSIAKKMSDDKSAKFNFGRIGWVTAFEMVYLFEDAIYRMKVGELSMPVRTEYGYHIIKLNNSRKALGKVKVAHIWLAFPAESKDEETKSKIRIDSIYNRLVAGDDFAKLAQQYSMDHNSAVRGGELPWFGKDRMVPEFETAAFSINKVGDYLKPIKTSFGWHIIKLLEKKELDSFDNIKSDIKNKVSRDGKGEKSSTIVYERLKKEYNYKQLVNLKDFYKVLDTTIFKGSWDISKAQKLTKPLFEINKIKYNQQDFAKYLAASKTSEPMPFSLFVDKKYKEFINEKIREYEESRLEEKYPDFKYLMKEYHDGILLFDLTDKMVWTKAMNDTIGLTSYYEKVKNKFMWGERVDAVIYSYNADSKQFKKIMDAFANKQKKNYTDEQILKMFNDSTKKLITIDKSALFSKGDDPNIDKIFGMFDTKEITAPTTKSFETDKKIVFVNKKLSEEPKVLNEVRGLVTADYQNVLEDEWVNQLRKKYQINVNKDILYSITK